MWSVTTSIAASARAVGPSAGSKVNVNLLTATNFADSGLTNGVQYFYVVTAVDQAGNESVASASASTTPIDAPATALAVKVNFADAATVSAGRLPHRLRAGLRGPDQRQPGDRQHVRLGGPRRTSTPVTWSATAAIGIPAHRRPIRPICGWPPSCTCSWPSPDHRRHHHGSWEMAVPNGAYTVTVGVGDAGTAIDSANWVNIEGQNAIAAHVPSAANKFATATRTVIVADGRLTLSPVGGTNTKLDYVDIAGTDVTGRPVQHRGHPRQRRHRRRGQHLGHRRQLPQCRDRRGRRDHPATAET